LTTKNIPQTDIHLHRKDAYRNHSAYINTAVLGCVHNTNHRHASLNNMQHGQTLTVLNKAHWNYTDEMFKQCSIVTDVNSTQLVSLQPCQQNNHGV